MPPWLVYPVTRWPFSVCPTALCVTGIYGQAAEMCSSMKYIQVFFFSMPWFEVDNRSLVEVQCSFTISGSKSCLGALLGRISILLPDTQADNWKHNICGFCPKPFPLRERRWIIFPPSAKVRIWTAYCSYRSLQRAQGFMTQVCSKHLSLYCFGNTWNPHEFPQTLSSSIHNFVTKTKIEPCSVRRHLWAI